MSRNSFHPPWWIKPYIVAPLVTAPLLVVTLLAPPDILHLLRREKSMDINLFMAGASGIFFMGLTCFLTSLTRRTVHTSPSAALQPFLALTSWILLFLTFFAYAFWLGPLLLRPSYISAVVYGHPGAVYVARSVANKLPGVTSLTQLGIVYAILYVYRLRFIPGVKLSAPEKVAAALLLALTVFRAAAVGERLALLEVVIPPLLLLTRSTKHQRSYIIGAAPVIAALLFFVFFAAGEYTRTWSSHYKNVEDDFSGFIVLRLFAYYVSALDTGAAYFAHSGDALLPFRTAEWFWKLPVDVGQVSIAKWAGIDLTLFNDLLVTYANPEFNNPSGLYMPFADFGLVGGLVVWSFIGWCSGVLYRSFRDGSLAGCIYYPLWFVFIIEMPRSFAFGGARYFVPQLALACVLLGSLYLPPNTGRVAQKTPHYRLQ